MSMDDADTIWEHMRKQATADLPDEDQTASDIPAPAVSNVGRCVRCFGTMHTPDRCTRCGWCVGCEGGEVCAA
jgi:hypothetical protein